MDGHNFFLLLLAVASLASSEFYHIVPSESPHLCEQYSQHKCTSLAELPKVNDKSEDDTFTLIFSPGKHSLTEFISVIGISNVTLVGNETQPPLIYYEGSSGFIMSNVSTLSIANFAMSRLGQTVLQISTAENISIENCQIFGKLSERQQQLNSAIYITETKLVSITKSHFESNYIHVSSALPLDVRGGVLYIDNVHSISLIGTSFLNNHLNVSGKTHTVYGGVIYLKNIATVTILNCTMTNNTAVSYGCNIRGGVLFSVRIDQHEIINSTFERNFVQNARRSLYYEAFGGAIYTSTETGLILTSGCQYVSNVADRGGSIYIQSGSLSSSDNLYMKNFAYNKGGAIYTQGHSVFTSNDNYTTNRAQYGAAIVAYVGNMTSTYNWFNDNTARMDGGAISVNFFTVGFFNSSSNHFINNTAGNIGGAVYVKRNRFITSNQTFLYNNLHNHFYNNNAGRSGGATYVQLRDHNLVYNSSYNYYHYNNAGESGGAVYVIIWGSSNDFYNSLYNHFTNNTAREVGGAIVIYLETGTYLFSKNFFSNNSGRYGGAVSFKRDPHVLHTRAIHYTRLSSEKDTSANNTAKLRERYVISGSTGSINMKMTYFTNNRALQQGAAIHLSTGVTTVSDCVVSGNQANDSSVIYINGATFVSRNFEFSNNVGSLFAINSQIELGGLTKFVNNIGNIGGAITSIQSTIQFKSRALVIITGNRATHGGGISLSESQLNIYSPVKILGNTAMFSGGGIYAYQSEILIDTRGLPLVIYNNIATSAQGDGGGACLIASNMKMFPTRVQFSSNSGVRGGAMFLEQSSKIYFFNQRLLPWPVMMDFRHNLAKYGGALYISDNIAAGVLCKQRSQHIHDLQTLSQAECFMQSLSSLDKSKRAISNATNFINFKHNSARNTGNDVYGGLVDRCSLNPMADPHLKKFATGLQYIKAMATFNDQEGTILTRTDLREHITSDAVQVCLCMANNTYDCSVKQYEVSVMRGETFEVKVTTVDQIQNQVHSTVIATFSSIRSIGHFKEDQAKRKINNTCTELEYNVYSESPWLQVDLYADGPCGDKGISKRTLNITFLPCDCPIGFQPSESTTECVCDCDKKLDGNIANCSIKHKTVQLSTNAWIGYVNESTNNTGFIIYSTCPFDYCLERPINISLNIQNGADMQCAFNRTNLLCGECEEGLSLVLGTSNCKLCTNEYLSLLLLFALFGTVLVAFILILNMTVATGTIHGLIFYANTIGATQSTFFFHQQTNPTMIFISWLNLDLGIEFCFYNGMNSYAKALLQLAFPLYLIFLTVIIIVLGEYSQRFAALLSNKNPVATLSTLILLSYSKLLRTIIVCLQYTYLDYPDGSSKIVWLYDANVPYFQTSHIPRFIIASTVIVIGAVYTILLFFGQWLPRLSNRKFMKWIRHPKYNAFIDAYHAPFSPKHRYWVGLLLLARIVHNLVISLMTEGSITLLSISCIALSLVLLKTINTRTYKNWTLDTLENMFLVNLIVLCVGTLYVRETKGNQLALISISTSIAFLTFVVILCYHIYKYLLKNTRLWVKLTQVFTRRRANYQPNELVPVIYDEQDSDDDDSVVGEVTDDYRNYTGDESIASMEERNMQDPPIIRSALILDQLREPALDILDPVTPDHYREARRRPPAPAPRPVTHTVIDRPSR